MDLANAIARRSAIITQLAQLSPVSSVGEGGRSVAIDRAGLLAELDAMNKLIALLQGPIVITSTGVAYP